jgi:hypothetical protein
MGAVTVVVWMPDDLLREWLQYVRNFDTAHPGCDFGISAFSSDISMQQITEILDGIDPPFASRIAIKNK